MNVNFYILLAILSILFGFIAGCFLRLLDEGISVKLVPTVFKIIYCYTFGFVGFVEKNKKIFIETLANAEIEKGTEDKKEIVESRTRELQEIWSKKFLRYLRWLMIKQFIFNYDSMLKNIIQTTREISVNDRHKNGNVMRHFSFADIDIGFSACMKAGHL